ncbi:MAG TPA: Rieske (2Fe-2S) protein [Pirellulaceae bacterium]
MTQFVAVAKVGALAEGKSMLVMVGEKLIALFHDQGRYYAISDVCPHMGASLADGHLEHGIVTCPWHAWRFRVADGTWCDNPTLKIESYEVRVEGDEVQVAVGPSSAMDSTGGER